MSVVGNLSEEVLNEVIASIKSPENQIKIHTCIIEPVIKFIGDKAAPYFMTLTIMLSLNIILLIIIIYILYNIKI